MMTDSECKDRAHFTLEVNPYLSGRVWRIFMEVHNLNTALLCSKAEGARSLLALLQYTQRLKSLFD